MEVVTTSKSGWVSNTMVIGSNIYGRVLYFNGFDYLEDFSVCLINSRIL